MYHGFNIKIAEEVGVTGALVTEYLHYWIKKNIESGKHYYDGSYWTYNGVSAMADIFPYLSEKQIRAVLEKLRRQGIIKAGNYNKTKYDRTLWYAFTEKGKKLIGLEEPTIPLENYSVDGLEDMPTIDNPYPDFGNTILPKGAQGDDQKGTGAFSHLGSGQTGKGQLLFPIWANGNREKGEPIPILKQLQNNFRNTININKRNPYGIASNAYGVALTCEKNFFADNDISSGSDNPEGEAINNPVSGNQIENEPIDEPKKTSRPKSTSKPKSTTRPKRTTKPKSTTTPKREKDKGQNIDSLIAGYIKTRPAAEQSKVSDLLYSWLDNRASKRAARTNRAIEENLKTLDELAKTSNLTVIEYLTEIIKRGWVAFYPIRQYNGYGTSAPIQQGQTQGNLSEDELAKIDWDNLGINL